MEVQNACTLAKSLLQDVLCKLRAVLTRLYQYAMTFSGKVERGLLFEFKLHKRSRLLLVKISYDRWSIEASCNYKEDAVINVTDALWDLLSSVWVDKLPLKVCVTCDDKLKFKRPPAEWCKKFDVTRVVLSQGTKGETLIFYATVIIERWNFTMDVTTKSEMACWEELKPYIVASAEQAEAGLLQTPNKGLNLRLCAKGKRVIDELISVVCSDPEIRSHYHNLETIRKVFESTPIISALTELYFSEIGLALAMSQHDKLGQESWLRAIPTENFLDIWKFICA